MLIPTGRQCQDLRFSFAKHRDCNTQQRRVENVKKKVPHVSAKKTCGERLAVQGHREAVAPLDQGEELVVQPDGRAGGIV